MPTPVPEFRLTVQHGTHALHLHGPYGNVTARAESLAALFHFLRAALSLRPYLPSGLVHRIAWRSFSIPLPL
jgi:hypothetical protein